MEVAVGPTVGLKEHVGLPVFLHGEKEKKMEELVAAAAMATGRRSNGFCFVEQEEKPESSESSSIGEESSSEEDPAGGGATGEDEAQSKLKDGPLGSLDSLEESLPIKRGLSNFFTGKAKSFASMSDVAATAGAGDLAKPENPFNKRRRIFMACKLSPWSRRASYSSLLPPLPPLTAVEGDEDDDDEPSPSPSPYPAAAKGGGENSYPLPPLALHHHGKDERVFKKAFRSPRSFSLSDLQHA